MSPTLLTDRDADEDTDTEVVIHVPKDEKLNRHLSVTDGTIAATVRSPETGEVTALLTRDGDDGKATLVFRVASANGRLSCDDLQCVAAALSDELPPFIAVRPHEQYSSMESSNRVAGD